MKFLSTATLLLTSVASISAQNTTSAQNTSQNAPTGILATIEQQINNVIPGMYNIIERIKYNIYSSSMSLQYHTTDNV